MCSSIRKAGRPVGSTRRSVEGHGEGEAPNNAGWEGRGTVKARADAGPGPSRHPAHAAHAERVTAPCSATPVASLVTMYSVSQMHRMRTPLRSSSTRSTSVPFRQPGHLGSRRVPHAARHQPDVRPVGFAPPRHRGFARSRTCSPFGSPASSTPGPLKRLPVDETRGFAPPPHGGFALSWLTSCVGRSTCELEQNSSSGSINLQQRPRG